MALCGARRSCSSRSCWPSSGPPPAPRVAVGLLALSPLALGPISLNTYDAWPALLTVLALWFSCAGGSVGFGVLGLAVSAKVYPLVLVPLACISLASCRPAPCRARVAVLVSIAAASSRRSAAYAPHGVYESFRSQAERGLQVESLGASLLLVLDRLGLYDAQVVRDDWRRRPQSDGRRSRPVAAVMLVLEALAVASVWVLYARVARPRGAPAARLRGRGRGVHRVHEGFLAAVPRLAAAAGGARRRAARLARSALAAAALVLAQVVVLPLRRALPARVAGLAPARARPVAGRALRGAAGALAGGRSGSRRARRRAATPGCAAARRAGPPSAKARAGRRSPARSRRPRSTARPGGYGKLSTRRRAERCAPSELVALTTARGGISRSARAAMRSCSLTSAA